MTFEKKKLLKTTKIVAIHLQDIFLPCFTIKYFYQCTVAFSLILADLRSSRLGKVIKAHCSDLATLPPPSFCYFQHHPSCCCCAWQYSMCGRPFVCNTVLPKTRMRISRATRARRPPSAACKLVVPKCDSTIILLLFSRGDLKSVNL